MAELFSLEDLPKKTTVVDKTLVKKMALISSMGHKEKAIVFSVIDLFTAKKKLRIS